MDSFEFNKIVGCILAAGLVIFGSRVVVEEALHRDPPAQPGYLVDVSAVVSAPVTEEEEEVQVDPIGLRLVSADVSDGAKVFRKCATCHSIDEGGGNKVGPKLWGVVGRQVAAIDNFAYSNALQSHGGAWSHEQLDGFLLKPKEWVPGTSMGYAGLKKPEDRANLIAYLRENTPNPPAIEAPAEEASQEEAGEAAQDQDQDGEQAAAAPTDDATEAAVADNATDTTVADKASDTTDATVADINQTDRPAAAVSGTARAGAREDASQQAAELSRDAQVRGDGVEDATAGSVAERTGAATPEQRDGDADMTPGTPVETE